MGIRLASECKLSGRKRHARRYGVDSLGCRALTSGSRPVELACLTTKLIQVGLVRQFAHGVLRRARVRDQAREDNTARFADALWLEVDSVLPADPAAPSWHQQQS